MSTNLDRRSVLWGAVALGASTVPSVASAWDAFSSPIQAGVGDWKTAPIQTKPAQATPRHQAQPVTPEQPATPHVQQRQVIEANELRLRLHQVNGGWNYSDVLVVEGKFDSRALRDLNHFMRDWRDGHTLPFSPTTAMVLANAQKQAEGLLLNIFSGVRSKRTNEWLRSRSSGVAKNSWHLRGNAADGIFAGMSASQTARLFRAKGGAFVKSYSAFAHIDSRGA